LILGDPRVTDDIDITLKEIALKWRLLEIEETISNRDGNTSDKSKSSLDLRHEVSLAG
jgi:hypothetical protein